MVKILIKNEMPYAKEKIALLKRYKLGRSDPYGRGRWLEKTQMPYLKRKMIEDPNAMRVKNSIYIKPYNGGRFIRYEDFERLFK